MRTALFYGNCQVRVLYDLIKDKLETNGIQPVHVQEVHLLKETDQAELRGHAYNASIFIGQHITPNASRPGSDELAARARFRIVVPNAFFNGYHQHLQIVNAPHGRDTGCLAIWSLVRQGLLPDAVQEILLQEDAFNDQEVLNTASASLAELRKRESEHQIDIPLSGYISERWRDSVLFKTANHPSRGLLIYVANRVIEVLTKADYLSADRAELEDGPHLDRTFSSIDFIDHLLLPGIAKVLNIASGIATPQARIAHRERFKLPNESLTQALSIFELAKEHKRWCSVSGWDDRIRANDLAALQFAAVRSA